MKNIILKNKEDIDYINNIPNENDGIVNIDNKNEIAEKILFVYDMLDKSYNGNFLSANNSEQLLERVNYITLFYKSKKIIACAVYGNFIGHKLIGIGSDKSDEGKKAVKEIIKRDIEKLEYYYWAEVSGVIEYFFAQNNGNPIPNIYASEILSRKNSNITLLNDGIHYTRNIGGVHGKLIKKCIYGFKNKEIYEKIMNNFNNYENFKKEVNDKTILFSKLRKENNINEGKSFYSNEEEIKEAYAIIETLEEYHIYGELNELSQLMYDYLIWAIDCLKNIKNKNNENQKALNLAINLLKSMPLLKLRKIII